MKFRTVLFWIHLIAGTIAGLSIGIMCFTGAALAFESELVNWAERDARVVAVPPTPGPRVSVTDMLADVREEEPDVRPSGITISSDPAAAVAVSLGRDGGVFVNPYSGTIRRPESTKMHDTLHVLEDWHRVLALSGDNRATGKLINGICNIAFFVLAITGIYLWFPRSWSWRNVRSILLFNWEFQGKARDFNWHNVIGLWSAPVLIVLTLTAIPISFRWGSNLIFRIAGETPPAAPAAGGPGQAGPTVTVPTPPPGTKRLDYDALIAVVQKQFPNWETLTIRLGGNNRGAGNRGPANATGVQPGANAAAPSSSPPASATPRTEARGEARPAPQAVAITVKLPGQWPRTATTTVSLDPFTGTILKTEGYADQSASRQIRSWTRFLHTGQALGLIGQLAAGLACLGGCVLVYTGFALAIRRFLAWRRKPKTVAA